MSRWGLIDNTLEGRQRVYFPNFTAARVPLDPEQNRRWRHKHFATTDPKERALLRKMCSEDFLFYCAGFLSLFDAGDESGKPGPVPFIPYEFQVELFTLMWSCLHDSRRSIRVKKPRKLGLSWSVVALFEHCWHFMSNRHLLVGSHREEEVDSTVSMSKGGRFIGEWSRLLPKFDFLHVYQPTWLLPEGYRPRTEPYRTRMKLMNPANGSIVWGTSAASVAGHGERGYAAFWDEASRTDNLYEIIGGLTEFAPSKFWVSTIGNLDHPFSTVLKEAPGVVQASPTWDMHPVFSEGLVIDPETGKKTSPWLDRKLDEINHDAVIANQQYFADESVQQGGFYGAAVFTTMLGTSDKPGTVMDPIVVGELDTITTASGPQVTRFCPQPNGRWKFWVHLDAAGRPPRNTKYILGADIAAGTVDTQGRGASNSVLVVIDWLTGEVVAQYVTHGIMPHEFAAMAAAAGRWFEGEDFGEARMNFDRTGPAGAIFGAALTQTYGYTNLWRDTDDQYGWIKDGRSERPRQAFGLHQQMICEGRFKERDRDCAREMQHYQNPSSGKGCPVHSASLRSEDPSGARDNHGDRTIARIVALQILQYPYEASPAKGAAPWGSARMLKERREAAEWAGELA